MLDVQFNLFVLYVYNTLVPLKKLYLNEISILAFRIIILVWISK